jgi:hypothetical protein
MVFGAICWRKHLPLLGLTFICFGISDVVETRTGGWYKPWWMLVWKVSNVILILSLSFRGWRRSKLR